MTPAEVRKLRAAAGRCLNGGDVRVPADAAAYYKSQQHVDDTELISKWVLAELDRRESPAGDPASAVFEFCVHGPGSPATTSIVLVGGPDLTVGPATWRGRVKSSAAAEDLLRRLLREMLDKFQYEVRPGEAGWDVVAATQAAVGPCSA